MTRTRLAGYRAMMSFGRAGIVAEVDATGAPTFELTGLEGGYQSPARSSSVSSAAATTS